MSINECCNVAVVCCDSDTPLPVVAELMRKHHVGDVIVTERQGDERVPVGIVTDRDIIIETIAVKLDPELFTAGDIMTTPVVTVGQNEGLVQTLREMRHHKIRRMPVVTPAGTLYGIVTADDIMNLLVMELSLMTEAITEQPEVEARLHR